MAPLFQNANSYYCAPPSPVSKGIKGRERSKKDESIV